MSTYELWIKLNAELVVEVGKKKIYGIGKLGTKCTIYMYTCTMYAMYMYIKRYIHS